MTKPNKPEEQAIGRVKNEPVILKEGTVIFKNGVIVEINDFVVDLNGDVMTLREYVLEHYKFIPSKKEEANG